MSNNFYYILKSDECKFLDLNLKRCLKEKSVKD